MAYNSAEEQYDEEDRRHQVAWVAVKDKKDEDNEFPTRRKTEVAACQEKPRRLVPAGLR